MADEETQAQDEADLEFGQEEFMQAPNRDNPYVSPEEQGMDMVPHVMGPPAYGSPDPRTAAGRLLPIEDNPLADEISDDYGADAEDAAEEAAEGIDATTGAVEFAQANNVDLHEVTGTGTDGRITKADVENYLASKTA